MSRSRIVYVLGSLAANDTGDEILSILGRLSRSRFEPRVIALGGQDDLRERIVSMKVRVYNLGLSGPWGTWRAVGGVRDLIRKVGADVLHGFGSWGGSVAQLSAPQDMPVVRTVTTPPTHGSDLIGRVLRFLERRAQRNVRTRFIVPNEGSRGLAVRAYGAPDGHVHVLPTAIDVSAVRKRVEQTPRDEARRLMRIGEDQTAVVLVSDFSSDARMDRILSGLATAALEHPGLRMFVLGSGRYETTVRWKAQELQLGDSVVFLGQTNSDAPVWAAADFAVDATADPSWSRLALFGIAAGLPTVKRQDGNEGWSEELDERLPMISGQPERFAVELVGLVNDAELRERVAKTAADIRRDIDIGSVVHELAGLYEDLGE